MDEEENANYDAANKRFAKNLGYGGWIVLAPLLAAVAIIFIPSTGRGGPGVPGGSPLQWYCIYFMFGYWPIGLLGAVAVIISWVALSVIERKSGRKDGPPFFD